MLAGRDAGLIFPVITAFLQFGKPGELGHRWGRQVRKADRHGLEGRSREVFSVELRGSPLEAAVAPPHDFQ